MGSSPWVKFADAVDKLGVPTRNDGTSLPALCSISVDGLKHHDTLQQTLPTASESIEQEGRLIFGCTHFPLEE
jgi:glutamate racemase